MAGWCACRCVPECVVCARARVSVWVNGERERATARQRERREVVREVQYSIYKLALYEELERCVSEPRTHTCMCTCVCVWPYKNMIPLLIGAFVRGPYPHVLVLICALACYFLSFI